MEADAIYDLILRMVLWGEPREDVIHKLGVNGITGDEAEEIYQKAFSERVMTIRARNVRKIWIGVLFIGASTAGFFLILSIFQRAYVIFALGVAVGVWKLADGAAGFLMASKKEGSVAGDA